MQVMGSWGAACGHPKNCLQWAMWVQRGHGLFRYSQGRHGVSEGCVQRTDSLENVFGSFFYHLVESG